MRWMLLGAVLMGGCAMMFPAPPSLPKETFTRFPSCEQPESPEAVRCHAILARSADTSDEDAACLEALRADRMARLERENACWTAQQPQRDLEFAEHERLVDAQGAEYARRLARSRAISRAAAQPIAQPAPTCSSDYQCGLGCVCVKPNFSTAGTCMKAVTSTGVPSYQAPSLDSVGPKMPQQSDCHFNTDCAVGFRCDTRSGACIR